MLGQFRRYGSKVPHCVPQRGSIQPYAMVADGQRVIRWAVLALCPRQARFRGPPSATVDMLVAGQSHACRSPPDEAWPGLAIERRWQVFTAVSASMADCAISGFRRYL